MISVILGAIKANRVTMLLLTATTKSIESCWETTTTTYRTFDVYCDSLMNKLDQQHVLLCVNSIQRYVKQGAFVRKRLSVAFVLLNNVIVFG